MKSFIITEIINAIVRENNIKDKKVTVSWNQDPSKRKIWKEIHEIELYAFINLFLLSGVRKFADKNLKEMSSIESGRPIFCATL